MVYTLLIFLALLGRVEAVDNLVDPSVENEFAQIPPQRFPPPPPTVNAYLNALRERVRSLQQENIELKQEIINLQPFRKAAEGFQQHLENLQQEFSTIDIQNQDLQMIIKQAETRIGVLTRQHAKCIDELQRNNELLEHAQEQLQLLEQQSKQDRQELQDSALKTNKFNDDVQKMQATLEEYKQRLDTAQQKVEKFQQMTQEVSWLNEQIQSKNKKIGELNQEIGDLSKQNYDLGLVKNISEQQLQDKDKRLEVIEQAHIQSLKNIKDREASLQSALDEKSASITKLHQEHDALKAQLDKEISINNDLRKQLEDSKKK